MYRVARKSLDSGGYTVIELTNKIITLLDNLNSSNCLPLMLTHCLSPSGTLERIVSQRRRNFLTYGLSVLTSSVKWFLSRILLVCLESMSLAEIFHKPF